MKEKKEVYLTQENEFKQKNIKKRKIGFLIVSLTSLIFTFIYAAQIIMFVIIEKTNIYVVGSFYLSLVATIVGGSSFIFFMFLFLVVKTKDIKSKVIKKEEVGLNKNKIAEVEVIDNFADLTEYDEEEEYEVEEEKASNEQEEEIEEKVFDLTTSKIASRLLTSMHNYSIHGDEILILSSLMASNLLFIKDNSHHTPLLSALSLAFSGEAFLIDCSNFHTKEDLYQDEDFLKFIKEASNNPSRFYFFGLYNIPNNKFENVFVDFMPSLYDKNNASKIALNINNEKREYMFTQNIFFLVFNTKEDILFELSDKTLRYSLTIDPQLKEIDGEKKEIEEEIITVLDFKHVITNTIAKYYISDNRWNKIDDFVNFLNNIKPCYLTTDVINNFEAFTGALLSLNASKDETFDYGCAYLLFPSIFANYTKDELKGEEGVLNYLSANYFSEYALPKLETLIKDAIRKDKEIEAKEKEVVIEEDKDTNKTLNEQQEEISNNSEVIEDESLEDNKEDNSNTEDKNEQQEIKDEETSNEEKVISSDDVEMVLDDEEDIEIDI